MQLIEWSKIQNSQAPQYQNQISNFGFMLKFSDRSRDYLIQVVLIVGSVLLALWMDQLMVDLAKKKLDQTIVELGALSRF